MTGVAFSRRSANVCLLLFGIASAVSGFVVQINYHMGSGQHTRGADLVWGYGYPAWALFHQGSSVLFLVVTAWHLALNRRPLFASLRRPNAWRRQGSVFLFVFTVAVVTALFAWTAGLVLAHQLLEKMFIEIHDKVTIVMTIFLAVHIWDRRSRLLASLGVRR